MQSCPHCGADVPPKAKACPECGSDEQTGWSETAGASGLDLPDEEFNYEEFVEKEFGGKQPKPHGLHWFWWVAAVLVLVVFLMLLFRAR